MRDTEFSYVGTELDAMAGARNYYDAILDRFGPHLGRRVVEVGAGIGSFSERLLGHPGVERAVLMEPDAAHVARLRGRFAGDPRVEIVEGFLEAWDAPGAADAIVLINVLEHVEDDVALLRAARERLVPGGRLLLFVPALPAISGSLDEAFGHFRRYTAPVLRAALAGAGFRVDDLRYVNFPGILSWFVAGRVLRKRTLSASDVRLYDRWVVPWVSRIEKVIPPPSGQSLLAVAVRGDG